MSDEAGPGKIKQAWRNVRPAIVAPLIYAIASLIGKTLRIESRGFAEIDKTPGGKLHALWHGRTFIGATFFRNRGCWTVISQSKDGDMQSTIFSRFGFKTIRGSTGRGGVKAAIESVRALKEGGEMAFTPDGPRGPSGVVQDGLVLIARKAGVPVYPVALSAKRRILAKSWDRYMIPLPFSRALVIFGEPMYLTSDATREEEESFRSKLQARMHELEELAEREFGHPKPDWHKA